MVFRSRLSAIRFGVLGDELDVRTCALSVCKRFRQHSACAGMRSFFSRRDLRLDFAGFRAIDRHSIRILLNCDICIHERRLRAVSKRRDRGR